MLAAHSKRLWQSSAYIALTVLTVIDRVEVRQILDIAGPRDA